MKKTLLILSSLFLVSVGNADFIGPLPGTIDFFNLFLQKFENAAVKIKSGALDNECTGLTKENRAILGDSNPVTGEPQIKSPNTSFWEWYVGCLDEQIIPAELPSLSSLDESFQKKYVGEKASRFLKEKAVGKDSFNVDLELWSGLPETVKEDIVLTMVDSVVGLELVEEFGFDKQIYAQNFIRSLKKSEEKRQVQYDLTTALRNLTLMLYTSNEFLIF